MSDELQSYVVNYEIEYKVKPNPFTEVVIRTKRTDTNLISRPEDIEIVASTSYDNNYEPINKLLYEKVHQEINMYNDDDYMEKVSSRLVSTEIKPTKDYEEHYKVQQVNVIQDKDNELKDEREVDVRQVDN
tara:strand:- start:370 stop:762 length:393 start_codon:yes stop_codon:yes gene_type:complete